MSSKITLETAQAIFYDCDIRRRGTMFLATVAGFSIWNADLAALCRAIYEQARDSNQVNNFTL